VIRSTGGKNMIISKMVPFQTVSVAIIQQFNFNKEIFPLLFSEGAASREKFMRTNTVDTDWFDDEAFRTYLFGNDSAADVSGNVCRYCYQAAHLEFGDERNVKKLGIGTNYYIKLDENTSNERQISFRFMEWTVCFWKNGTGYISCNISLNSRRASEQKLVMQDIALFVKALNSHPTRRNGNIIGKIGQSQDRDGRFSLKDVLCGSSTSTNQGAEKLGIIPKVKNLCSYNGIESNISVNETKKFYIVYAVSDGIVNGRMMDTDDIKEFISPTEFRQMIGEADFPENKVSDEKIGQSRKNIDNHYWSIGEKSLICMGFKDSFLVKGNLWKSIYSKYMILYQYFLNIYDECREVKGDSLDYYTGLNQRLTSNILGAEAHGHIQDLFQNHLCKNVWNLQAYIRKMQRKIKGDNFALEEYLDKLRLAKDRKDVQLEVDSNTTDEPFIFISYVHDDFKEVYDVLARLYKRGMNFWYDKGLEAGENWMEMVKKIIESKNCEGTIFFISEKFFQHTHTLAEAEYVRRQGVKNFSINLNNTSPTEILRKILQAPEMGGFDINTLPERFNIEYIGKILYCFQNGDTYIRKDLVERDLFNAIETKGWDI